MYENIRNVVCGICRGRTEVQLWYNRFKEGRDDVNDAPGRSSTSTTEAVIKIIVDKRRITIKEIAYDVGISFGSWQGAVRGVLGMRCTAAIWSKKNFAWTSLRRC